MKLLLFTDIHNSAKAFDKVREKASHVDVVVCGGDISMFGHGMKPMLKNLSALKKPVVIIPGNHEEFKDFDHACAKHANIYNVHRKTLFINGLYFQGYGGGGFSFKDQELEDLLPKFLRDRPQGAKLVFLSHAPPYKTKLDPVCGEPAGSKSLRWLISKLNPDVVVCGHLHDNFGTEDKLGSAFVINPGPEGKIISL